MLLVYMHEVPDLNCKHGIRRLDRYDQLAEYVWGEWLEPSSLDTSMTHSAWRAQAACCIVLQVQRLLCLAGHDGSFCLIHLCLWPPC
jgi:hypothetical protein